MCGCLHVVCCSLFSWGKIDKATAIASLARTYFHCYGPASEQDFRYWSARCFKLLSLRLC